MLHEELPKPFGRMNPSPNHRAKDVCILKATVPSIAANLYISAQGHGNHRISAHRAHRKDPGKECTQFKVDIHYIGVKSHTSRYYYKQKRNKLILIFSFKLTIPHHFKVVLYINFLFALLDK
jgi:hypothetical protein